MTPDVHFVSSLHLYTLSFLACKITHLHLHTYTYKQLVYSCILIFYFSLSHTHTNVTYKERKLQKFQAHRDGLCHILLSLLHVCLQIFSQEPAKYNFILSAANGGRGININSSLSVSELYQCMAYHHSQSIWQIWSWFTDL